MKTIKIKIPSLKILMKKFCRVPVASAGNRWSKNCLKEFARGRGVYIIHERGQIKYVGKTGGETMNYGMRLRRSFQEKAAQGKGIYSELAKLSHPRVSFIPEAEIRACISGIATNKTRLEDEVICLMEAALIHEYNPKFQQREPRPKFKLSPLPK